MKGLMGRRRQSNLDLPPRMHLKSGTYYYVTTDKPRKWISLGKDLNDARKKWAEIEAGPISRDSFNVLLDQWLLSEAFLNLAANTQKAYKSISKQLKITFEEFSVQQIEPHHIAAWQDAHHSKVVANTGKSILTNVLNVAVRRGLINRNPAKEVENLSVKRRSRYITHEEYLKIRNEASPVLRAAMDISYVTGARIGDVLQIRLSHISDEGLLIRQGKTNKLQLFKRNAALDAVIANAKAIPRPVRGMFLLCTMKGQKYHYNQLNSWWGEAREAAGIPDVNFHDIRGKSATDAKRSGMDYQALLGHTTKAMSDSYIKLEDAEIVEPLRSVL